MGNQALADIRRALKQIIYNRRKVWTKDGYQPLCAICGKPPRRREALQMHETFITRGDVSGNLELGYDIMTRYNCVLVHSDCHIMANTDENKWACAVNILKWEKYRNVRRWLGCMQQIMGSTIPGEAIRLLNRVRDAQSEEQ